MTQKTTRRDFLKYGGLVTGGAIAGPALLTACGGGSGGGGDTFKVGAVLELSGPDSAGGQLAQRGYQFWADTVNKAGGIKVGGKAYKVELVTEDCQSKPDVGATAADRLISQKGVDAFFGAYTSGVQLATNAIFTKYQMPCIAGSAESPGNWSPQPAYTYGIIPSVDLTAGKAINLIVQSASSKPASAAIVGANEPFSKDAAAGFAQGAKQAGLRVTENSLFPPSADLTPIVSRIASRNPDIVAVGGHDTILINFVKACKSAGFKPKALIMHYGVTEPSFIHTLKDEAEGVLGLADWTPDFPYKDDVFGTAQQFAQNYQAKYHTAADYTGAGCAVSGEVLQLALAQLGKGPGLEQSDRAKLGQVIAKTNIKTFYGPVKFDASGAHFHDNTTPEPLLLQVQQGKLTAVAPGNVKKASFVYPRKG